MSIIKENFADLTQCNINARTGTLNAVTGLFSGNLGVNGQLFVTSALPTVLSSLSVITNATVGAQLTAVSGVFSGGISSAAVRVAHNVVVGGDMLLQGDLYITGGIISGTVVSGLTVFDAPVQFLEGATVVTGGLSVSRGSTALGQGLTVTGNSKLQGITGDAAYLGGPLVVGGVQISSGGPLVGTSLTVSGPSQLQTITGGAAYLAGPLFVGGVEITTGLGGGGSGGGTTPVELGGSIEFAVGSEAGYAVVLVGGVPYKIPLYTYY